MTSKADPFLTQRIVRENADEYKRAIKSIQEWAMEMKSEEEKPPMVTPVEKKKEAEDVKPKKSAIIYPRVIPTFKSPQKSDIKQKEVKAEKLVFTPQEKLAFQKLQSSMKEEKSHGILAKKYKEEGLNYFKANQNRMAILCFSEAISQGSKSKESVELLAQLYNNRSAAHYYLQNYASSLADAKSAFSHDPTYFKPIMRSLNCCVKLEKWQELEDISRKALLIQPDNEEVKNLQENARKQLNYQTMIKLDTIPIREKNLEDDLGQGDCSKSKMKDFNPMRMSSSQSCHQFARPIDPYIGPIEEELVKAKEYSLSKTFKAMKVKDVPPKPKNSTQFFTEWQSIKDNTEIASLYLRQLDLEDFDMFQNTMEDEHLSEILDTLVWEFLRKGWLKEAEVVMEGLLKVTRLDTLIMFLSQKDRANLRKVLFDIDRRDLFTIYQKSFDIMK